MKRENALSDFGNEQVVVYFIHSVCQSSQPLHPFGKHFPIAAKASMPSRQIGSSLWRIVRPPALWSSNALRYQSSDKAKSASILGSANDYISNLRWKAANALTSSLPEEERSQLLEKFEPEKSKDEKPPSEEVEERSVPDRSIDEIVAAARAEEAEKHKKRWDTVKGKLQKEAEEAARRRVESDLATQQHIMKYAAWEKEVEEAKREEAADIKEDSALVDHPILGPVLADLGSKRIHVVAVDSLSAIPVWKKQRHYRHSRAKGMATDKMKTLHLGLPGIIGVYESADGRLSIIDGQHRVGMLKELQTRGPENFDFDKILVEVYPQPDGMDEDAHAGEIFVEVNKAEPMKMMDLPGAAKASHKKVINETASSLKERYPEMFSESQSCRKPHLNEDNLRDALFLSTVIDRHSIRTTKQLQEWIIQQNEAMKEKYQDETNQRLVSATALNKANKHDFFLGLGSEWLNN